MVSKIVSKSETVNTLKKYRLNFAVLPPFNRAFLKAIIADELGSLSLSYKLEAAKLLIHMRKYADAKNLMMEYGFTEHQESSAASEAIMEILRNPKGFPKPQRDQLKEVLVEFGLPSNILESMARKVAREIDKMKNLSKEDKEYYAGLVEYKAGMREDVPSYPYAA